MVITRSTPSCSRRVSVGEPEVVTTNCPGARPDAAWAERAVSSKRGRLGPAGALMPSPSPPASSAIFRPKPPATPRPPSPLALLRPDPPDDHRHRRLGPEEATRPTSGARPHLAQRADGRFDG